MYVVSSCLLGRNCKYNGGNNEERRVLEFLKDKEYIEVCPETYGGLKMPRPPAELCGDRVLDREGKDVTFEFEEGARLSLEKVRREEERTGRKAELAILKQRSPSCGSGRIYDGTFSGKTVVGNGICTRLFLKNGIPVISEEDI